MEKWKIVTENTSISGMDLSQITELASAMMESWATSSSTEIIPGHIQGLGIQSTEQQVNKGLSTTVIKQEPISVVPQNSYEFISGGVGYLPVSSTEQVPMDDFDPLEPYSFWEGENFYTHQELDACASSTATDMYLDNPMMPPLEYIGEDDMTQEDVFPMDKDDSDFLRNPTLAELNSCTEGSVFEYVIGGNNNNSFLADDNSFGILPDNLSKSYTESHFVASPVPSTSSFASGLNYVPSGFIDIKQNLQPSSLSSSCPVPSRLLTMPQQFLSTIEDTKFPLCPQNSPASDTFFQSSPSRLVEDNSKSPCSSPLRLAQRTRLQTSSNNLLSSSAPPDVTMPSYLSKIKRELPQSSSPGPRSVTERSLSGFSLLSLSNDDESGSFFDDEDDDDDFSSDEDVYQYESDDVLSTSWPSGKDDSKSCQHRKHRFFWQYNLQSRGAKTQNILPRRDRSDPHILNDAFDPVFSEECSLPVKHSGKARRGDGNDLTPDPKKLFSIGVELKKLNKLIYNVAPSEGGSQVKPLSRKEKNKLASRVCRLKKKAQHEANKIKLYGLQQEHKKLLSLLIDIRELLKYKIGNPHDRKLVDCTKKIETFLAANEPYKVAGEAATFVNDVLERVSKGEADGGLGRL